MKNLFYILLILISFSCQKERNLEVNSQEYIFQYYPTCKDSYQVNYIHTTKDQLLDLYLDQNCESECITCTHYPKKELELYYFYITRKDTCLHTQGNTWVGLTIEHVRQLIVTLDCHNKSNCYTCYYSNSNTPIRIETID